MVSSRATTVAAYLDALPPERRAVVAAVRDVIRRALPRGYEETMAYGMIGYSVPLARYPRTYNGQPLGYAALAAQKNHYALYLTAPYQDPAELAWLQEAWRRAGRRLDMGKSCVRFKTLEDLPLDVVGECIGRVAPDAFIATYERSRAGDGSRSRSEPSAREPSTREPSKRAPSKRAPSKGGTSKRAATMRETATRSAGGGAASGRAKRPAAKRR